MLFASSLQCLSYFSVKHFYLFLFQCCNRPIQIIDLEKHLPGNYERTNKLTQTCINLKPKCLYFKCMIFFSLDQMWPSKTIARPYICTQSKQTAYTDIEMTPLIIICTLCPYSEKSTLLVCRSTHLKQTTVPVQQVKEQTTSSLLGHWGLSMSHVTLVLFTRQKNPNLKRCDCICQIWQHRDVKNLNTACKRIVAIQHTQEAKETQDNSTFNINSLHILCQPWSALWHFQHHPPALQTASHLVFWSCI